MQLEAIMQDIDFDRQKKNAKAESKKFRLRSNNMCVATVNPPFAIPTLSTSASARASSFSNNETSPSWETKYRGGRAGRENAVIVVVLLLTVSMSCYVQHVTALGLKCAPPCRKP